MGDDLIPAGKAIEELEPAVQAFAEATGVLGPVREFAAWATDLIRDRRAPYQARLLMSAAKKIRESGLPPSAVPDKLLRAVLEDGPMEDDEDMQDRWANLLANAGTSSVAEVRAAFPTILSELEPDEAAILDKVVKNDFSLPLKSRLDDADFVALANLERLGLVRYDHTPPLGIVEVYLNPLGWAFLQACRAPRPAD
jgi:Abortive infection alpha